MFDTKRRALGKKKRVEKLFGFSELFYMYEIWNSAKQLLCLFWGNTLLALGKKKMLYETK